jgi:hypothetical protein
MLCRDSELVSGAPVTHWYMNGCYCWSEKL